MNRGLHNDYFENEYAIKCFESFDKFEYILGLCYDLFGKIVSSLNLLINN